MTQERIDSTEDGLRKQISKYAEEYLYPTSDVDMGDVENILHCINSIGLIAELKRCYEEIDRLPEDCFRTAKLLTDNGVWLTEATLYESLKRYEKQLHLLEEARKASG